MTDEEKFYKIDRLTDSAREWYRNWVIEQCAQAVDEKVSSGRGEAIALDEAADAIRALKTYNHHERPTVQEAPK